MAMMMSSRSVASSPIREHLAFQRITTHSALLQRPAKSLSAQPARYVRTASRGSRLLLQASSASADVTAEGPGVAGASPYIPLIASAGFAAAWVQNYSVHSGQLLAALAAVALAQAGLSVLRPSTQKDWVSTVAAPAVLAWNALNLQFHYTEVAIAVFGWYLLKNLEGPALAWAATLAVALYTKRGAEWYAIAYAVVAGWKLLRGYKNDSKVGIQLIPPVLASAWAIYKQVPLQWTLILIISQIAGSAFGQVASVSSELSN